MCLHKSFYSSQCNSSSALLPSTETMTTAALNMCSISKLNYHIFALYNLCVYIYIYIIIKSGHL